jgi:hypothetical protein
MEALLFRSTRRETHMSNPVRVEMFGPLSEFAPGFLEDLIGQGYRPGTAAKHLQLMAHLSGWLAAHDLESGDLTALLAQ